MIDDDMIVFGEVKLQLCRSHRSSMKIEKNGMTLPVPGNFSSGSLIDMFAKVSSYAKQSLTDIAHPLFLRMRGVKPNFNEFLGEKISTLETENQDLATRDDDKATMRQGQKETAKRGAIEAAKVSTPISQLHSPLYV